MIRSAPTSGPAAPTPNPLKKTPRRARRRSTFFLAWAGGSLLAGPLWRYGVLILVWAAIFTALEYFTG